MLRGVFTIGSEHRFVDALARGVLQSWGGDPLALADIRILVPTRRAVRALHEAFRRQGGGRAMILPRLIPLGDVDEPELILTTDQAENELSPDLPPAMPQELREMLLARQILAFRAGSEPVTGSVAQALQLAREMAGLLDELLIEGVAFDRLESVVDAQFAAHWQRILAFLRIVGEHWPKILAERGVIDAIDRRNRLLRQQAKHWRETPPETPVIAAGTTGSQPATRELLAAIASLPQGCVVLPGLDRDMDEPSWSALESSHPQFGLRELLAALDVSRRSVADWPTAEAGDPARRLLLSEIMRPAETTEIWSTRRRPPPESLAHVVRVDCVNEQQEAVVAALALRQALEQPGHTAALVTPDRDLARRVVAELRRWGVEIDDSAGMPLLDTPPASLLRLLAAAVDAEFRPVPLLALLKHPLCAIGLPRGRLLSAARLLDRKRLRGPVPAPGLASLRALVAVLEDIDVRAALTLLVDRLEQAVRPLVDQCGQGNVKAAALLDATLHAAEAVAATDTSDGAAILWSGPAGETLASLAVQVRPHLEVLEAIRPGEWPALLDALMQGQVVRPPQARQSRLAIWGPLEARLQRADLVILGGLNEGTWPRLQDSGAWLNRPMRRQLGLPQPERRIGLSAHDFISAFAADQVMLLRAERMASAPTVPARWLSRLDALLGYDPAGSAPPPPYIQRGLPWRQWAEALDRPAREAPLARPMPRPPVSVRPRRLSVSSIEQWRRDPYGLYARRILRLEPLDPLQAQPGAAERGEALHRILDRFVGEFRDGLPPDAFDRLVAAGEKELAALLDSPAERAFWWPRFRRLARWFTEMEQDRRRSGVRTVAIESSGKLGLAGPAGPFEVTARADRLDLLPDGTLDIIDYKTGRVPARRELEALFAPQLLLEAAIARASGFPEVGAREAAALSYWRINGLGDGGEIVPVKESDALIPAMLMLLQQMIDRFDDPATTYVPVPWPSFSPTFNDYEHLERTAEWSLRRGGSE